MESVEGGASKSLTLELNGLSLKCAWHEEAQANEVSFSVMGDAFRIPRLNKYY